MVADKDKISGAEMRDKVMGAIEACRDLLAAEPPERMTEYWGTVSGLCSSAASHTLPATQNHDSPSSNQ
jgi:hypothetical protein